VKGSGLGLFIVRSVTKRHGGRAYAESEGTGKGSTFTMLLPRAPDQIPASGAARVDAAAPAVKR
jgi:signal transduction histidine kinase